MKSAKKTQAMRILMVTPEVTPVVKVGGLADVVGSLAKVLHQMGHDVRIVLPRYRNLKGVDDAQPGLQPLVVHMGEETAYARVWHAQLPDSEVPLYCIEHNAFFDSESVYTGPSGNELDNGYRFAFFNRAAIDLCSYLQWTPEVFHLHDWPTALLPIYLNTTLFEDPIAQAASVLTLHNMQHQGHYPHAVLRYAGLPESTFRSDCLESYGNLNFLKGGIYNAGKITTVSPTYAREIQSAPGGCGLDPLLRSRAGDLIGILNGIDTTEWAPQSDPLIPATFFAGDLSGKATCKKALQAHFGLEADPRQPLFGIVSRLVDQKGLDLLATILPRLLSTMKIQVALIGTGDPALENTFARLAERFEGQLGVFLGFDNGLAHTLIAGSDFLIMPSRFEPCGLSQIYAMRYGTLPIVRDTGGLRDTVESFHAQSQSGSGFVFRDATPGALYDTIGWACSTYYDLPDSLHQLRLNAMSQNFSWDRSAKDYENAYRWAIAARKNLQPKTIQVNPV
jgi:starch synthase